MEKLVERLELVTKKLEGISNPTGSPSEQSGSQFVAAFEKISQGLGGFTDLAKQIDPVVEEQVITF